MEIRTPIVAIIVLSILIIIYLRKTKPQLSSSRVFFAFLMMAFINILSEIAECYVFVYLGGSYNVLRRGVQNFYIGSLLTCTYVMTLYVCSKVTIRRSISARMSAIPAIPLVVGLISILTGKARYGRTQTGFYYNYGTMIIVCYFIGFFYLLAMVLGLVVHRKRLRREEFIALFSGALAWLFLAAYQYYTKGIQVSSIAMMVMALVVFLVIENPKELFERALPNVKNKDAFTMYLLEKYGLEKPFFIISVIFTGKTSVQTAANRDELYKLQADVAELIQDKLDVDGYLSNWNTLSFVVVSPEKIEEFMNIINNYKVDGGNYKLTFAVIDALKCAKDANEALQILVYVSGEYIYKQSSPNLVIDESVIDKMRYRNTIEDVVRESVRNNAFEVYYQPILSVKDGAFSSAEALVRLKRPDSANYISPEDFIPIAEKCGLIQQIDDLVFEKVCSFIAKENISSFGVKTIEVNLSGNEVVDHQAFERLSRKMEKYHIPPKFINFEITETAYINNDEVFRENVRRLKEMGSTFSMDDFGSGYSNLLEILKMDYILVKMDKEFIWNCLDKERPENLKMLQYTINFLKEYGLHILAEGVETMEQAKILIDNGVEYLQGFYYSRPIPEKEYIEFLNTQKGLFEPSMKGE